MYIYIYIYISIYIPSHMQWHASAPRKLDHGSQNSSCCGKTSGPFWIPATGLRGFERNSRFRCLPLASSVWARLLRDYLESHHLIVLRVVPAAFEKGTSVQ